MGYHKQTQKHINASCFLIFFFGRNPNKRMVFGQHIDSIIIGPSSSKECCLLKVHHHDQFEIYQNTPAQMASWTSWTILHHALHTLKTACMQLHSCNANPAFESIQQLLRATSNININNANTLTHTQDINQNNNKHESKAFGKPCAHVFRTNGWSIHAWSAINWPSIYKFELCMRRPCLHIMSHECECKLKIILYFIAVFHRYKLRSQFRFAVSTLGVVGSPSILKLW